MLSKLPAWSRNTTLFTQLLKMEETGSLSMFVNKTLLSIVTLLLLFNAGCSTEPTQKPVSLLTSDTAFGQRPNIASIDKVIRLQPEQKERFLRYFNSPNNIHRSAPERIYTYLELSSSSFNYKERTYPADQALALHEGNCMSLAILTTAFAKLSGTKIEFQLIDASPVFQKSDDVIIRGVHVRTKLYDTVQDENLNGAASVGLIVDYFPGDTSRFIDNLSFNEFAARYYRNIAVELLEEGKLDESYWYAMTSLEQAPDSHESVNMLAVIYKRKNMLQKAEELYLYGIEAASEKITLLKNYHILLSEQGRELEAAAVFRRIESMDEINPYAWQSIADRALDEGRISQAIKFYRKSIELAPYLEYGYLGLARCYFLQGKLSLARSMLVKAKENNSSQASRQMYEAKIFALDTQHSLDLKIKDTH